MKKLFSFLLTVAASLALVSCVKEQVPAPDPAQGGEPVNVSFSLHLGDALTKAAPEASAFDNASGEFKLYVAVFAKSNGSLISTSRIGGTGFLPVETITSEKTSVIMTLSRSQDYKVVFFAMRDGAYAVNFADNNVAKFSFKSGLKANDASLDAFYAAVDVASSTKTYDVTLKRPFAQLNMLVPQDNVPKGQTSFSSAMSVTAPASFDLFAGAAVDTDVQTIAFADNAIAADAVGSYKGTHKWIGMIFVLVPKSGTVDIASFQESGMSESVRIGSVPVKVNGRTNLVGQIYSLSDYVFNLEIDPEFGDDQDLDLGEEDTPGDDTPGDDTPEDTEISVVDGKTFTTENPLVITAAQSVKLRVNGDDIATVEKGAGGAKVTAKSADETVAKVAVANNDVVITPVADGTTTVTINTPAYTKASYAAQTLVIPVKVEGMGEEDKTVTATLTVTPASLSLKVGETATITATTNSSAKPGFASDKTAVATVDASGKVTAVAEGTATVTVSVAAVEGAFTAASKTVSVTVTKAEGGETPQEGNGTQASPYSVAKALALTNALDPKGETADKVYVKGKISEITDVNTGEYGNATYFISDDGSKTGQLQVFRGYYLGGEKFTAANQIAVGDEVIVYGKLKNYQNNDNSLTPEVTGSQIYSLNGETASAGGGGEGQGGGGDVDTSDASVTLTNAEIQAATVDASMTDDSTHYGDGSITSTSGTWTGNFAHNKNGLKYLQLRNKKGAYLKSPVFPSNVKKIVVTISSDASVTLYNRALYAIPPTTTIPTGDEQYAAELWANKYGTVETGTTKGAKVTLEFTGETKQFTLVVGGGATYIDEIAIYY